MSSLTNFEKKKQDEVKEVKLISPQRLRSRIEQIKNLGSSNKKNKSELLDENI